MAISTTRYNRIINWLALQLQGADPDKALTQADIESFFGTAATNGGVSGGNTVTGNEPTFGYYVSTIDGVRPNGSNSTLGTAITPGNNTKGSWTQVLAATAQDCYVIQIDFTAGATSTAARDIIADIGVDPAGGTSYSVVIPDLLASCAAFTNPGYGVTYTFRVKVTAGSTIACRASVNNATVGAVRCSVALWGQPSIALKAGTGVRAFGITAASSSGTAIAGGDIGTTAEGTWTQVGTDADACWQWQVGFGINNATMAALNYHCDVGIGDSSSTTTTGTKTVVQQDARVQTTVAEASSLQQAFIGTVKDSVVGNKIYARTWCSGTPDTGISMAVYGVYGTAA